MSPWIMWQCFEAFNCGPRMWTVLPFGHFPSLDKMTCYEFCMPACLTWPGWILFSEFDENLGVNGVLAQTIFARDIWDSYYTS